MHLALEAPKGLDLRGLAPAPPHEWPNWFFSPHP